jgi:hypothetical protein
MTRSTRAFEYAPRLMTHFDLAVYLRRSEGWLKSHLPALQVEGFPPPDCLFDPHGMFDRVAIDAWLDGRAKLPSALSEVGPPKSVVSESELLKRIDDARL